MSVPAPKSQGQIGSLIISALFVLIGVVTLFDTFSYTDRDSKVFPQTVAIILIITATIAFVTRLLKPDPEGGFGEGIWWRRVIMVAAMYVACFLMPLIGFLPAAAIAFVVGLISAMHDSWRPATLVLYTISSVVIVLGFYALFKFALLVPLP